MPKTESEYWLRDLSGQYAVTSTPDDWTPRGWAVTNKEPRKDDLVWATNSETGGSQVFAYGATEQWAALGWQLSEPPTPRDLTKDPVLVDQAEDETPADEEPVVKAAPAPKKSARAKNEES